MILDVDTHDVSRAAIDEARRDPGTYWVWVMDADRAIRLVFGDEPPIRPLFEDLYRIGSCSAVTTRFHRISRAQCVHSRRRTPPKPPSALPSASIPAGGVVAARSAPIDC